MDKTSTNLIYYKDGIKYQPILSNNEESIRQILNIDDIITQLDTNIFKLETDITEAQANSINKIVFCNTVPEDSISKVNTLYLTRTMNNN